MSNAEWDSVVRIGSKVRPSGGTAAERERVIKGKSAINAAARSGAIVGTEKKYGSANSKSNVDGQHLTKVDRENGPVKPKEIGAQVGQLISKARLEKGLTQKDLAKLCNIKDSDLAKMESGTAIVNQDHLSRLENRLKIHLRGAKMGQPKEFGKKK
ncbi:uncharacterized protein Z518_09697 [Rhinocladiella mackenziei CBS 650.93]|uniref:Multiprotein-bridging factor 1 n=1 Tax=Rhinocladiella mackenziei CBS 650.93 TaxID=1442369 RepID=A0A0D2FF43_9EURO|nr:uncharacterized protein Z518_09697 [Rhinocladiella mackenziei CBS 650.93]KIX00632.1 hypothetical protein Z518_09697 [Rhinocladiella mackenziei CBS 650.93]